MQKAICEAAQRPTTHFAAVKSEEQQASADMFRVRDHLETAPSAFRQAGMRNVNLTPNRN